jgi:hypothetical protein
MTVRNEKGRTDCARRCILAENVNHVRGDAIANSSLQRVSSPVEVRSPLKAPFGMLADERRDLAVAADPEKRRKG